MRAFSRWLTEERDTHLLALARIALATLLFVNDAKLASSALGAGYFGDFFHIPIWPEAWVPSERTYLALLAAAMLGSALAAAGVLARASLVFSASIGLFLLGCDRLDYHNNRYVLLLLALLVGLMPCDRCFRLSFRKSPRPTDSRGPFWAVHLAQIQISLVYLSSAGSKLLDPDWRSGQVLHVRYLESLAHFRAIGQTLPAWLETLISSHAFGELSSKAAIGAELFLAFGLWFERTRALALWLGSWFHLGIELGAQVELFSFVMLAAYLMFCKPELRERRIVFDPEQKWARRLAALVHKLDWLMRFRLVGACRASENSSGASSAVEAPLFSAIDRDGRACSGFDAWLLLSRAIPLFFPFWLPLRMAAWMRNLRASRVRTAESSSSLRP